MAGAMVFCAMTFEFAKPAFAEPTTESTTPRERTPPRSDGALADANADRASKVDASFDDVSAKLEAIRAKHKAPALVAVSIGTADVNRENPAGLIARGVAGKRALARDADAKFDDQWHLGSCTKAMTATLCALLVQDGKLKWESSIGEVFVEQLSAIPEHYRSITLEQLLRHTSGLPGNLPADATLQMLMHSKATPERDRRVAFQIGMKQPPVSAPGEAFLYSNIGYMIAGMMAEQTAGRPYEELMQERIFTPLGMTSAGFGPPGLADRVDQPRGHRNAKPFPPDANADNPRCYAPAGTLHCSMEDWAKFVLLHLKAARGETTTLSPENARRLRTPSPKSVTDSNGYAMGWLITQRPWAATAAEPSGMVMVHSGSNTMWFCSVWIAPAADLAVMAATNAADAEAQAAVDEACAMLIEKAGK